MYHVLIAEDDEALRFVYSKMKVWAEYGFKISAFVSNGQEAINALDKLGFDLIITDIKMPLSDGFELMKEINRRKLSVPVILVSSYDDFEHARQGIIYGAFDYILKPAEEEKLKKVLERVRKHLQEKYKSSEINKLILNVMNTKEIDISENGFIRKICVYLSDNIYRNVSMKEAADAMELSKDYFGKIFRKITGMTFNELYSLIKIEQAKFLIDTENLKNYEISEKLGYAKYDYFSKIFKEVTGFTPTEYKNRK